MTFQGHRSLVCYLRPLKSTVIQTFLMTIANFFLKRSLPQFQENGYQVTYVTHNDKSSSVDTFSQVSCLCFLFSVVGWFQPEFSGNEGQIFPFSIGYSKGTPVANLLLDLVVRDLGTASMSS